MLKLKFPRYLPLLALLNKENFFLSENNYHTTNLLNGCDNIRNGFGYMETFFENMPEINLLVFA